MAAIAAFPGRGGGVRRGWCRHEELVVFLRRVPLAAPPGRRSRGVGVRLLWAHRAGPK